MTTQAKNKLLAYLVLGMLAIVALVGTTHQPKTVHVMLPKATPVVVALEKPPYDQTEFECLRSNIYFEARNESIKGMRAVALVALERTKRKHYPETMCGVVKFWAFSKGRKVCHFSWYCDGKTDRPNLAHPIERKAWDKATLVADAAMRGMVKDFLGSATHYHANYARPDWSQPEWRKRYKRIAVVGTHIFYRDVYLKLKA